MGTSLEFLGIARKAGFLEIGEESCSTAVSAKKAKLLISAADASDNSKRNARRMSELINVPHIEYSRTKDELGAMIGRGSPGVIAVTDVGLAAGFVSRLADEEPGVYGEALEQLEKRARRAAERRQEAKAHQKNVRMGKRRRKKE